jgi:hypothetical protein
MTLVDQVQPAGTDQRIDWMISVNNDKSTWVRTIIPDWDAMRQAAT